MDVPTEDNAMLPDVKSLSDLLEESIEKGIPGHDTDSDRSESDEFREKEMAGQQSTIKTLYEGPEKCECCINWVEEPPEDVGPGIEQQAESKRHALLIRMKKSHDSDRSPFVLDSIVIQSPHLKELLGRVFEGYNGITTSLERLVFRSPFKPFFYEWEKLREVVRQEQDPIRREHGQLLRKTLQAELKDIFRLSKDHARNEVITFRSLWTVFKPGIDVYAPKEGFDAMYRLFGSDYKIAHGCEFYQLEVHHVDFDGKGFGYQKSNLEIYKFEGTVPIACLNACPADLYPRIGEVRHHLHQRGQKFQELQETGLCYKSYQGLVDLPVDPSSMTRVVHKMQVDGRIVVDPDSYAAFNPYEKIQLKPLSGNSANPKWDVSDQTHHSYWRRGCRAPPPMPPDLVDEMGMCQSHRARSGMANNIQSARVPDELLYLCSPQVRGYSFKIKKWSTFWVDLIDDVKWNEGAFESLVLPRDHKRLMLSFVDSQIRNKKLFDDVIEGKGQGIVILLEGSPGVGKTLTAEALADRLRKPLYTMSIAELGSSPNELESRLMMILEMAVKWDAVVLLDESDVFLEKRSPYNLHRNGIVAIFLRLLEYFRGVLIMTTNRVKAMDPAFQSRIHLKIQYPDLPEAARYEIWKRMVGMSGQVNALDAEELGRLARLDLNGREIKNLVKSAQLLASYESMPLSMDHIQAVLGVTQKDVLEGSE